MQPVVGQRLAVGRLGQGNLIFMMGKYRYDRLLLLNRRLIANDAPQSVMTMENIQQAYGENIRPSLNGKAETPFFG